MQPPGESSAAGPPLGAGRHLEGMNSRYFRMQDLRRLRNLFFSSRKVVQGQYAGRHASSLRGHSVEFNDYRQYMPGDELGDIDWKVYGRTDKLFIKLFEHQSDMAVNLLVDASASMAYAGLRDGPSKYDQACMLAAAVAFLTVKQQDKVSFSLASEGLKGFVRPHGSFGHFVGILRTMEAARPQGRANLAGALRSLAGMIPNKGLLIVLSDLLDDPREVFDSLSIYTHRGCEAILFHVLHADELALPDLHDAVFVDSESAARLSANVDDLRDAYGRRLRRFLDTWSAGCKGRGIDYRLISTSMTYHEALAEYLFQRASME
jgi:uncharacterized protein (DUF58 family)